MCAFILSRPDGVEGPAASAQSYLDMDKILSVIKKSGAQAVHPGYGFLSENNRFVQLLEENGVAFIGPNQRAISGMPLVLNNTIPVLTWYSHGRQD